MAPHSLSSCAPNAPGSASASVLSPKVSRLLSNPKSSGGIGAFGKTGIIVGTETRARPDFLPGFCARWGLSKELLRVSEEAAEDSIVLLLVSVAVQRSSVPLLLHLSPRW